LSNGAEHSNLATDGIEAESVVAATDHVMAAWDVSDWWNTATVVRKRNNEVI
jgi:hypothetical protein